MSSKDEDDEASMLSDLFDRVRQHNKSLSLVISNSSSNAFSSRNLAKYLRQKDLEPSGSVLSDAQTLVSLLELENQNKNPEGKSSGEKHMGAVSFERAASRESTTTEMTSPTKQEDIFPRIDWDDGHKPAGAPDAPTMMTILESERSASKMLSIFDEVLPPALARSFYDHTIDNDGNPWGTYVTLDESAASDDSQCTPEALGRMSTEETQRSIAMCAVKHLFIKRAGPLLERDYHKIHGVAVWSLSAGIGSQVRYHIDYAELYRYKTNVICPPLYAGTMHLTPVEDGEMIGGDFFANIQGLDHYRKTGYKCKLAPSTDGVLEDLAQGSDWLKVPFRFNRAIVHDGDFPHLSTTIQDMPTRLKRVILGFNLFTHDVGPDTAIAPEHSPKFNATVKLYEAMNAATKKSDKGQVTIADVKKNKGLAKLLVLLARQKKIKEEENSRTRQTTDRENESG